MNSKFAFNSLDSTLLYKSDLLKRIFFTLMALVCYRLGTYVPIPGINLDIINVSCMVRKQTRCLHAITFISGLAVQYI